MQRRRLRPATNDHDRVNPTNDDPAGLRRELAGHYAQPAVRQRQPAKVVVSMRLDQHVVDRLRASGPGWQTRANEMLKQAVLGRVGSDSPAAAPAISNSSDC